MNLSGSPFDYIVAFLGGVGVSFTPCVYPLIPITIGHIGAKAGGSKLKGLSLSLIFVTGVAVTYSVLGLLAVLTGKLFGSISSKPQTFIIVGIIIIFFGLSMLDLFILPLPKLIKLPAFRKENYFSTFFLGLSSGLVASPCLTPILGSILVYLTTKKNLFYGATLLFSFAYGTGFLLIIAGTFSSALVSHPRLGKWTVYINKVFSFLIIGIGIYFIYMGIRRL